jgi:hypothetical protein
MTCLSRTSAPMGAVSPDSTSADTGLGDASRMEPKAAPANCKTFLRSTTLLSLVALDLTLTKPIPCPDPCLASSCTEETRDKLDPEALCFIQPERGFAPKLLMLIEFPREKDWHPEKQMKAQTTARARILYIFFKKILVQTNKTFGATTSQELLCPIPQYTVAQLQQKPSFDFLSEIGFDHECLSHPVQGGRPDVAKDIQWRWRRAMAASGTAQTCMIIQLPGLTQTKMDTRKREMADSSR